MALVKIPKNITKKQARLYTFPVNGNCINSLLCKATVLKQNDRVSSVLLVTHDSNSGSAFFFSLKACLLRKVLKKIRNPAMAPLLQAVA